MAAMQENVGEEVTCRPASTHASSFHAYLVNDIMIRYWIRISIFFLKKLII